MVLRACYAVPGTGVAYAATVLRVRYAVSGTGIVYFARVLRMCYRVSGTAIAYGSLAALRSARMLLPGREPMGAGRQGSLALPPTPCPVLAKALLLCPYASPMPCSVLAKAMLLSPYTSAMRRPVLAKAMLLLGCATSGTGKGCAAILLRLCYEIPGTEIGNAGTRYGGPHRGATVGA
eukprot:1821733-Rhodomonas_salina.1